MKEALLDTNILSLFFREDQQVVSKFSEYLEVHERFNISIITYYEIISGLRHRDAKKQLETFMEFAELNIVVPLDQKAADFAANIYSQLRKSGQPIDDIDLLIAGTALVNDLILVTNNTKHFKRIESLEIEDWSQE